MQFQNLLPTDWNWEAAATLIAGAAAVTGAVIVGLRQTTILARQVEIQERLASIETLKLRAELFDKRFEVYEATVRVLSFVMTKATVPDVELTRPFALAMDRSRLLFDAQVYDRLRGIWKDVCDLGLAVDMLAEAREARDNAELKKWAQAKAELLKKFAALLDNPSALFGEHLRLSDGVDKARTVDR